MSYTIALDPVKAVNPATVPPALVTDMDRGPTIIGCSCIGAATADQALASLQIAPHVSAQVRYSLQGTRVVGVVIVQAGGFTHTMPFSVDASPIVKQIALAHMKWHVARGGGGDKIGFSLGSVFRTITSPVRAVVQQAQSAVKQATAVAAKLTPAVAKNFVNKAVEKGKAAIKTAKATWNHAAKVVGEAAKNKALQFVKTIVKSPITAGLVTAVAVAFPAVGAPALAVLAAANAGFAALDKANAVVSMVKGAEKQIAELLPKKADPAVAKKIASIQAEIKKAEPEIKKLQAEAAPVRAAVAKLTDAAKRGDRVAKLELSALRTTQTAQTKLRNKIVTAVIAARGAKTPAERAAAEAIALKRYLPSANLALSKYHPKMQALVAKAAPVIAAAAKAKAAKAAKALPAKAR
jgi:hypothetical protein